MEKCAETLLFALPFLLRCGCRSPIQSLAKLTISSDSTSSTSARAMQRFKIARRYSIQSHFSAVAVESLPTEALDQRTEFLAGRIDEDSLRIRLRLICPVVESRPWAFPLT